MQLQARFKQKNKKETDKIPFYFRNEKTLERRRKELSSKDPEMIAIRTHLLTRICINSGINTVKNSHEQQVGNCTQILTNSAGLTKKTQIRS